MQQLIDKKTSYSYSEWTIKVNRIHGNVIVLFPLSLNLIDRSQWKYIGVERSKLVWLNGKAFIDHSYWVTINRLNSEIYDNYSKTI